MGNGGWGEAKGRRPKISSFSPLSLPFSLSFFLSVFFWNCGRGSWPWTTQIVRLGLLREKKGELLGGPAEGRSGGGGCPGDGEEERSGGGVRGKGVEGKGVAGHQRTNENHRTHKQQAPTSHPQTAHTHTHKTQQNVGVHFSPKSKNGPSRTWPK